jgi:hypothetical protein
MIATLMLLAQVTSAGGLSWKAPAGWSSDAHGSSMRLATYRIPKAAGDPEDAELAIFFFGKDQGGPVVANVDRWLHQFSPDDAAAKPSMNIDQVNGVRVTRVSTEGTYASGMPGGPATPKRGYALLGAIAEGPGGNVFFKLTGPRKTVHAARAQFETMVASLARR